MKHAAISAAGRRLSFPFVCAVQHCGTHAPLVCCSTGSDAGWTLLVQVRVAAGPVSLPLRDRLAARRISLPRTFHSGYSTLGCCA